MATTRITHGKHVNDNTGKAYKSAGPKAKVTKNTPCEQDGWVRTGPVYRTLKSGKKSASFPCRDPAKLFASPLGHRRASGPQGPNDYCPPDPKTGKPRNPYLTVRTESKYSTKKDPKTGKTHREVVSRQKVQKYRCLVKAPGRLPIGPNSTCTPSKSGLKRIPVLTTFPGKINKTTGERGPSRQGYSCQIPKEGHPEYQGKNARKAARAATKEVNAPCGQKVVGGEIHQKYWQFIKTRKNPWVCRTEPEIQRSKAWAASGKPKPGTRKNAGAAAVAAANAVAAAANAVHAANNRPARYAYKGGRCKNGYTKVGKECVRSDLL